MSEAARGRAFAWVALAYLVALGVALAVGALLRGRHPLEVIAGADLAATLVVFVFGRAFRNASFYDPYWSVAPVPIALYLVLLPGGEASGGRQALVLLGVVLWAVRLTGNWARGWGGLHHEDWRYVDLKAGGGARAFLVDLFGIHLFPTLMVYLGCLPLWPALVAGGRPLGALDALALGVVLAGVALELVADEQLRRFRAAGRPPGAICDRGLWAWSRHPNYLGEILFWWGILLFGAAAAPLRWWVPLGAVAMTAMFHFASLPLLETRMAARRPGWEAHCRRVPRLLPRPWRRARSGS